MKTKKILTLTVLAFIIIFFNAAPVQPGVFTAPVANHGILEHMQGMLKGVSASDLSFCLGYIKNSKHTNQDMANFILTWSPDQYVKQIPSVFRSKIDRVVTKLASIDYQQLVIDIDFIKNSTLSVNEIVRIIDSTKLSKK